MFDKVMQKVDHWMGNITHFLLIFSGILILLMGFLSTYGVIMRRAFHAPQHYSYELSIMFLLFCGVLAVAGVEKLDQHVRNDLVASRFSPRIKHILLDTIFPFLALIFCAVLTWKSLDNALYALKIGQVSQSPWALPLAPIKMVIPLGYTLLCLVLLGKFIQGIRSFKSVKKQDRIESS